MKKLVFILIALILTYQETRAQSKPLPKPDTAKVSPKSKSRIKIDTITEKVPFSNQKVSFDQLDSADLKALNPDIPIKQYGYIDTADLRMTACDFEKDANAMVLFDHGVMAFGPFGIILQRHKRIKIFNDNGKEEANIKIEFNDRFGAEQVVDVEAMTITLINGKIVYTKLDPKLIYSVHTGKEKNEVTFTMPDVKAGSVIDYRYYWERESLHNIPRWYFQGDLPTRYSQLDAVLNPSIVFSAMSKKNKPYTKDTSTYRGLGHVWALNDISSAKDEPYMRSASDALQSLTLSISSIKYGTTVQNVSASWAEIGKEIAEDKSFYKPFDQSLHDDDDIVKQTLLLKTPEEKIAFIFNQVKTLMKWNEEESWVSKDGIKSAWKKKSGNWGEINMIVNHFLKLSGVKAYPMLVSTRDNGSIFSNFANGYQINKLVCFVPLDSTKYYVLDATDKFNTYNVIPFDILNAYGLVLNKEKASYELFYIKNETSNKQLVLINAAINANGSMKGTAQIASYSYNKSTTLELHKELDDEKYKEFLTNNDNNLKISSLKLENAEVDSLPLVQNIDFNLDLPGTDDKYIFFNPNLFTSLHSNPFITEQRVSDIDFGCNKLYSINGRYTIPEGYKIEALPKNLNLKMEDGSITFRRIAAEQDGMILVSYVINYKRSYFPQSVYPGLHEYFKKMTDILNEQIVLKKI